MSFHLTPARTMSLSNQYQLSILSYLRFTLGHTPLYLSQLLRGLAHVQCASSGYYNRISTISSGMYSKSQTCLSGKVMCDQPAKLHPQLPRRESLPRAIYFSENVSILIQDLSSFKDDCSVAFSMAHSVMLNNVEIYL